MTATFCAIDVDQLGDVFIANVRRQSLEEPGIHDFGKELCSLIDAGGCRKLVLRFTSSECLYSALMSELLTVRRRMLEQKGRLKLCEVPPSTREVFRVSKLENLFDFAPDLETAVRDW